MICGFMAFRQARALVTEPNSRQMLPADLEEDSQPIVSPTSAVWLVKEEGRAFRFYPNRTKKKKLCSDLVLPQTYLPGTKLIPPSKILIWHRAYTSTIEMGVVTITSTKHAYLAQS
ncbi:hypothetical protein PoB_005211100 [Plakobranchus ocellatus]|uniref:Uncharacterized protein n=1 Tax=Plakobranchus ocellatus TaxID=259542 RepID=A0AAV4C2K1_9GAST|nr:hypothetical protein PoB_005211100 [Plakobranchus ocellatus]